MPLFLFLSGYLVYQNRPNKKIQFVYKKIKGLLFPYFIWLFISILIVNNFVLNSTILYYLGSHMVIYDNIWFLPVLFISFIILIFYIEIEHFLISKNADIIAPCCFWFCI